MIGYFFNFSCEIHTLCKNDMQNMHMTHGSMDNIGQLKKNDRGSLASATPNRPKISKHAFFG